MSLPHVSLQCVIVALPGHTHLLALNVLYLNNTFKTFMGSYLSIWGDSPSFDFLLCVFSWECRGSVVECLTRDRGAAGLASPASLRYVLEQEH